MYILCGLGLESFLYKTLNLFLQFLYKMDSKKPNLFQLFFSRMMALKIIQFLVFLGLTTEFRLALKTEEIFQVFNQFLASARMSNSCK